MKYLEENAAAAEVSFTTAELDEIDELAPQGVAAGDRYPPVMMQMVNR